VGRIRIGISGWTYPGWRGDFYPRGLPQRQELAYAAERLTSIEINGSFYALQRPASYESWREQTPEDFEFAVKGSRYISHLKRLGDVETALANFFASGLLALGDKLGPVLWQLPETFVFDADRLAAFFAMLPRSTAAAAELGRGHDAKVPEDRALTQPVTERRIRYALEPRHPSFAEPAAVRLLREQDVAVVLADTAGRWPVIDEATSDIAYARLHGDRELYASGYTSEALEAWCRRVRGWAENGRDVYVYFDNDAKGRAPHDALALLGLLEGR
jgi:uncharacterized protein YecE (DUF72 family)